MSKADVRPTAKRVFRVSSMLWVLLVVMAVFVGGIGVAAAPPRASIWIGIGIGAGAALGIGILGAIALLSIRLEIGSAEVTHCSLFGSRSMAYADAKRAYFDMDPAGNRKTPYFAVESGDKRRVRFNLRQFPIEAAAILFTRLESQRLKIEVPEVILARSMADQIRAEQKRMRSGQSG
jgi:hypothetical protein